MALAGAGFADYVAGRAVRASNITTTVAGPALLCPCATAGFAAPVTSAGAGRAGHLFLHPFVSSDFFLLVEIPMRFPHADILNDSTGAVALGAVLLSLSMAGRAVFLAVTAAGTAA